MNQSSEKYTMRISRLTIDKLGIQMYDRISAVLAELIANAYDADANDVKIKLPFGTYLARREGGDVKDLDYEIVIEDDGIGMTANQVNEFYLNVGFDRRSTRGEKTQKYKRRVMGRKGIGKLAPFGVCREVEVVTAGGKSTDKGYPVSNLVLKLDDILNETSDDQGNPEPYHPQLGTLDGSYFAKRGTKLILRQFNRKRVPTKEELGRQLAARFGLSQNNWKVLLEDSLGEGGQVELGKLQVDTMEGTRIDVDSRPVRVENQELPVTGWVAYAKDPYKDEVMAGVRLYARGKIVAQTRDFDIKTGFTGEFKMRSYLTGEIYAEWLDGTADFVRTDRQDIIWNSEYGNALREWGRNLLKELAGKAETSTRKRVWDIFLEKSKLKERLDNSQLKDRLIQDSVLRAAQLLVTRADRDSIDKPDFVENVVSLAFALGPHRTLLETLDKVASSTDIATNVILELFEKASVVEVYSLGQVARERVKSIKQLERLVSDSSTQERQLQKLIEEAQWILFPNWTPLSSNQALVTTRKNFENWYMANHGKQIVTSQIENPSKQPDFVMLNHAGTLEIVEIKRPKHALTDDEFTRAFDYLDAVQKFVKNTEDVRKMFNEVNLTIVCDNLEKLSSYHARHFESGSNIISKTWHEILQTTLRIHEDFLAVVDTMQGSLPSSSIDDRSASF